MSDSLTIRHTMDPDPTTEWPDPHQSRYAKTSLGFWLYLMTDCILFSCFFIAHAVLENQTFGGATSRELFDLGTAFTETMLLLASSFTCGLAMLAAVRRDRKVTVNWLILTILLGACFLALELNEFRHLIENGHSWRESAFLSSFFGLVGLHGCHITVGIGWMTVMVAQVMYYGIVPDTFRRLAMLNMFWHFLDLIWIFIFTFVYLIGVV